MLKNAVIVSSLAAALQISIASSAQAAAASGTLGVSAVVVNTCSVASAVLTFGTVDPGRGTVVSVSAPVNTTCTAGTVFSVGLGDGSWALAANGQRRLKGTTTGAYLNYSLFQDGANLTRFGLSIPAQLLNNQVGLGALPTTVPVYGAIPAGQAAPADTYTDTIPIAVSY